MKTDVMISRIAEFAGQTVTLKGWVVTRRGSGKIQFIVQRVGFAEVAEVRAGKSFEIDLGAIEPQAAAERVAAMCEQLLANTVVEEYAIEVVEDHA